MDKRTCITDLILNVFIKVIDRFSKNLGMYNMKNKIMIAETERLILRRYKKEDVQDLYEYLVSAD